MADDNPRRAWHEVTGNRGVGKMAFPFVSAITAGVTLILQIILAFLVSGARGNTAIGDGGNEELARAIRRHGNLAENAGLFIAGLTLLELSRFGPLLLEGLCALFVLVRISHAVGMSQPSTMNVFRLIGGVGTYLVGLILGGALLWAGLTLR
jgi:uncharacterized protein